MKSKGFLVLLTKVKVGNLYDVILSYQLKIMELIFFTVYLSLSKLPIIFQAYFVYLPSTYLVHPMRLIHLELTTRLELTLVFFVGYLTFIPHPYPK